MQVSQKVTVKVTVHDLTARRWLRGGGGRHLRLKYLEIYHQISINGCVSGGIVRFEFKSRLLNLLWVPHYHRSNINTTCICWLLTLVHDGCLCIGASIPIMNMPIHRITHLLHEGLNPAKEFGEKTSERDLEE